MNINFDNIVLLNDVVKWLYVLVNLKIIGN